jgi:hypothetical protein
MAERVVSAALDVLPPPAVEQLQGLAVEGWLPP